MKNRMPGARSMNALVAGALMIASFAFASGCSTRMSDGKSGETHFLCSTDEDCTRQFGNDEYYCGAEKYCTPKTDGGTLHVNGGQAGSGGASQDHGGQPGSGGQAGSSNGDSAGCSCGSNGSRAVHQALACACSADAVSAICPASITAFDLGAACAQSSSVIRATGCSKVSLSGTLLSGWEPVFDERSGKLIGVYDYSDIAFGSCPTASAYVYGEGLFPPGV
jgi:hypothetical protein